MDCPKCNKCALELHSIGVETCYYCNHCDAKFSKDWLEGFKAGVKEMFDFISGIKNVSK